MNRSLVECELKPEYLAMIETWPRPIPVRERLPERETDWVLCRIQCFDTEDVEGVDANGGFWLVGAAMLTRKGMVWVFYEDPDWSNCTVTHWLPLPPAPEEA